MTGKLPRKSAFRSWQRATPNRGVGDESGNCRSRSSRLGVLTDLFVDREARSVGVGEQTPAQFADAAIAAGATMFTVHCGGPDYDLTKLKEWVAFRDSYNG